MRKYFALFIFFTICLTILILLFNTEKNDQDQTKENLFESSSTDRAAYSPGSKANFSVNLKKPGKLYIEYYHLNDKIGEEELDSSSSHRWSWTPPEKDFNGYLVKMTAKTDHVYDVNTIALDVSSDWSRFPRYGFLSDFGERDQKSIENVISELNRFHINGIQFYDWHEKHHKPIPDTRADSWEDVANRPISARTITEYITAAHKHGMQTMAYNLLYGAFEDAEKAGVSPDWFLYKDQNRNQKDVHPLPDAWKSNIIVMNTTHPGWKDYLIQQQKKVYQTFPFDGWHIDQLGDRGEVFNEHGDKINVAESFHPFLEEIKASDPDKRLVMNAVNQYGQKEIGASPVDFMYTEVWEKYKNYGDLRKIIEENSILSSGKNSVLAAYMNYEHSNQEGHFNEAGILLANSVIFSSGGSHLELGEHMLSKEYFPHHNLSLQPSLKEKLISYYDFLTAYQTLLRDELRNSELVLNSKEGVKVTSFPEKQAVWAFSKSSEDRRAIHFINFLDADGIEWRDTNGSQKEPILRSNMEFQVNDSRKIRSMWIASPDRNKGLPIKLKFSQENGNVSFILPSLKYWDMVVFEYK